MKNVEQMVIGVHESGRSVSFKKFVKDIADSKTKYEESLVMEGEIESLKKDIKSGYTSNSIQHERLVKLIYIHMLGYDATFGIIDTIKFAQQSSLFYKRVGYLVASLLLDAGKEESLLLCCTLTKDLNSDSVVEQSMALTVICQLMGKDTISVFLPMIIRKLSHPKEIIRKKAVDVMYQFLCEMPEQRHDNHYQKALCDPDAGVMVSALPIYLKLTRESPAQYAHMTKAFTDILMQIVEGRLHNSFNYHTFPAPWAQVYLLQILENVGRNNQEVSSGLSEVLHMVVARASGTMTTPQASDAATAVLYQVCLTILSIYPNQDLIHLVIRKIDEFLNSSCNKVHLGLQLLERLSVSQPHMVTARFVEQAHSLATHACPQVREGAVGVLGAAASPDSVDRVTATLLALLAAPTSSEELKELCRGVLVECGQRCAPSAVWYVKMLLQVLDQSSGPDSAEKTINILIDYCSRTSDGEAMAAVQEAAVTTTDPRSQKAWLSLWALGQYTTGWEEATLWAEQMSDLSESQRRCYFSSLLLLANRVGALPGPVLAVVRPFCGDPCPFLRQLAREVVAVSEIAKTEGPLAQSANPISELIEQLSGRVDVAQNSTAHKQLLQKFRKRVTVLPDHTVFDLVPVESSPAKVLPGNTTAAATGQGSDSLAKSGPQAWISYHEHMPEESSTTEKQEPPLSQPAFQTVRKWGTPSATGSVQRQAKSTAPFC